MVRYKSLTDVRYSVTFNDIHKAQLAVLVVGSRCLKMTAAPPR